MLQNHINLVYDGSFEGLLSCVFKFYDEGLADVSIQPEYRVQQNMFQTLNVVPTNLEHSTRVWTGLTKKLSKSGSNLIYNSFLTEEEGVEAIILDFCIQVFKSKVNIEADFSNPTILKLTKLVKKVSRERHRMTAFVRFRLTKDHIYFASIAPDFNVLPLIISHFKKRYADQQWIIYDVKRKYGIYFNLKKVEFVSFEALENIDFTKTSEDFFDVSEIEFQKLWKHYFNSVNIKSRKNMKLHTQHVPKRYWKYLSEKQP